jgi:hypothetical protein
MATPGQPTLYKPEYIELAHNYCLLGATNETLGDFFGVTRRTLQNWIATHPDFADAVHRGRAAGRRGRHGGAARCRRGEHAPCRRLSALIGVSLAEIAGIAETALSCRQHRGSAAAIVPP